MKYELLHQNFLHCACTGLSKMFFKKFTCQTFRIFFIESLNKCILKIVKVILPERGDNKLFSKRKKEDRGFSKIAMNIT